VANYKKTDLPATNVLFDIDKTNPSIVFQTLDPRKLNFDITSCENYRQRRRRQQKLEYNNVVIVCDDDEDPNNDEKDDNGVDGSDGSDGGDVGDSSGGCDGDDNGGGGGVGGDGDDNGAGGGVGGDWKRKEEKERRELKEYYQIRDENENEKVFEAFPGLNQILWDWLDFYLKKQRNPCR